MRGISLRSVTVAMACSLGIATVGLASANPSTSPQAASSATTLGAVHSGVDAATLVAGLDRPADRITQRRSTASKWALAVVVLVYVAVIGSGLARRSTPSSEVAARIRVVPWRAPQRAPPFQSLVHS